MQEVYLAYFFVDYLLSLASDFLNCEMHRTTMVSIGRNETSNLSFPCADIRTNSRTREDYG